MPFFRRLPKRGFNNAFFRLGYDIVNVSSLERCFDSGANVTKESLKVAGLIRSSGSRVKILGDGSLTKKLTVTADAFSKSAREKITGIGGEAQEIKKDR